MSAAVQLSERCSFWPPPPPSQSAIPPIPRRVLTVRRAAGADADEPDFSDVPNLPSLRNPGGVQPAALPLTLRMLCHVPILVSSRRSQTSGSPTHVVAKLWLAPLPAEAAGAAAAAPAAAALRDALAQGVQESFD